MSVKLEYVLSGCQYELPRNNVAVYEKSIDLISHTRGSKLVGHDLSFLFNALVHQARGIAYTEGVTGSDKVLKDVAKRIHADSGGLQLVTLGKDNSPELRDDVYRFQAKYSDIGMSFDEIPIKFDGDRNSRTSNDRWYDVENADMNAIDSGKNLNRQIDVFRETGSTCRPYAIMHGNCYDTYMRWCDLLLSEVSSENLPFIGGVAMGAGALGYAMLEECKKGFYYTQLNLPDTAKNEYHLLGVGSLSRMFPVVAYSLGALYENVNISYDSTSHSAMPMFRNFYAGDGRSVSYSTKTMKNVDVLYDLLNGHYPLGVDFDVFYDALELSPDNFRKKYTLIDTRININNVMILTNVVKFCHDIDLMLSDEVYRNTMMGNNAGIFDGLASVDNKYDFDKWLVTADKYMPSKKVKISKTEELSL